VIVGGTGNDAGALLGALLVPVLFVQGTTFLPQFGPPELVPGLQWIVVGLLGLIFVYNWPRGIIPEGRRRFPEDSQAARPTAPVAAGATAEASDLGGTDH
jgi:branched-chain amino acid transport system permease protein